MKKENLFLVFVCLSFYLFAQPALCSISVGSNDKHTPVTVRFIDGIYVFEYGSNSFSVSAGTGGRIVSYSCGGKELLILSSVHSQNYGATLWTSPQSDWGWPPSPVLDLEPYEATLTGDTLLLTSKPDLKNGYLFKKKFYINPEDSSVNIIYSITNISDSTRQVAAWDVLRTTGCLSFFPIDTMPASLPASNLRSVTIENGILWYASHPDSIRTSQKLFSLSKGGWLAHVYNGMLFVKTFPDIPVSALPPKEGEVEIYAHEHGLYIELENQGSYTMLQSGETLVYPEKWYLRSIEETTDQNILLQTVYKILQIKN